MKLADYLVKYEIRPCVMRSKLGINPTSFRRYMTNERKPTLNTMLAIEDLTNGEVTPRDFNDPSLPKCAVLITLPDGRQKVVLPWNDRACDLDACPAAVLKEPHESDQFSPPLQAAIDYLGNVKYLGKGWFELNGRPMDARGVVAAANRLKRENKQPPIRYPGLDEEE